MLYNHSDFLLQLLYILCSCWSSVGPQQNTNLNNSANLGPIGKIEISSESGGHDGHDDDVSACAHKHARMLACMHTILLRA